MELVLKTSDGVKSTVGSNPTLSAKKAQVLKNQNLCLFSYSSVFHTKRKAAQLPMDNIAGIRTQRILMPSTTPSV